MLATAKGEGTIEIIRRTGMSKPTVWRWQERYLDEGVPGLKRDDTRPSHVPPLPSVVRLRVNTKTMNEAPLYPTHLSHMMMADAMYDHLLQQNAKQKPFVSSKSDNHTLTRERRTLARSMKSGEPVATA